VCVCLKGIQGNRLVNSHRMEVICCVACILHLCEVCCASIDFSSLSEEKWFYASVDTVEDTVM